MISQNWGHGFFFHIKWPHFNESCLITDVSIMWNLWFSVDLHHSCSVSPNLHKTCPTFRKCLFRWYSLFKDSLGGGNSYICYFHPYLGKRSNLTNIFQWGWNHQLVVVQYLSLIVERAQTFLKCDTFLQGYLRRDVLSTRNIFYHPTEKKSFPILMNKVNQWPHPIFCWLLLTTIYTSPKTNMSTENQWLVQIYFLLN